MFFIYVFQLHQTTLFVMLCLLHHSLAQCRSCSKEKNHSFFLSDDFINIVNRANLSWKAKRNWPSNTTAEFLDGLSGTIDESVDYLEEVFRTSHANITMEIPESFDASQKWPQCASVINKIRKQGNCGSCWAVNSASVMTDRLCIATNASVKFEFSVEDILTCCKSCVNRRRRRRNGCLGGKISKAWERWSKSGFVSGGGYLSEQGCKPYSAEAFQHKRPSNCKQSCTNNAYDKRYEEDKRFGTNVLIRKGAKYIQAEIMANGPVVIRLKAHPDIHTYKGGVYVQKFGTFTKRYHALKVIGWGVENDVPYWLGVNSWGKKWGGIKGFLKIKRGSNQCDLEKYAIAGVPKPSSSLVIEPNFCVICCWISIVFWKVCYFKLQE